MKKNETYPYSISWNLYTTLFLLSTATLAFELNLSRLFSVAQFYHFAFMIVSIALLGFGASGTLLAIFPKISFAPPEKSLSYLSLATSISMVGSFLIINLLPFDSFSIAWDHEQVLRLIIHYIALSTPFFFSGLSVGILLSRSVSKAGLTYGINLSGSALGCMIALFTPPLFGGEGTALLSGGIAALATVFSIIRINKQPISKSSFTQICVILLTGSMICFVTLDLGLRIITGKSFCWLELKISPYKSLSYSLQYPDTKLIFSQWNSFSKVDLARSSGIRSFPGLSYRYTKPPPAEDGLFVDGDELNPIILPGYDPEIFNFIPSAIVYLIHPSSEVLILEPRGGLEILAAKELGASHITAVEPNPLNLATSKHIYEDKKIQLIQDTGRSALRNKTNQFDIIVMPLNDSYHPVRSGAYSLAEEYRYTIEAFQDALASLKPNGLLIATRWLQTPPSETLRLFAIALTALDEKNASTNNQVLAFRSFNTGTVILKNGIFTDNELEIVRQFCKELAYDLIYLPDITPEEINRFNILPKPLYYQLFNQLLNSSNRQAFYRDYTYDIQPPTDNQPFFSHYFKWSQSRQVLAELGKTWQPFGGAGYFVIILILILASVLSSMIILLPAIIHQINKNLYKEKNKLDHIDQSKQRSQLNIIILYFALIGFAFLLVEIPLIQAFILYLGHPSYSLTVVLFSILLSSGVGSMLSEKLSTTKMLVVLVIILLISTVFLQTFFNSMPGSSSITRIIFTILFLAPIGLSMGVAFPGGLRWMGALYSNRSDQPIAQIWAVNGASSVIASIVAALLSISFGFSWVLIIGTSCYLGACIVILSTMKWKL